jgi:hypothetical protein
VFPQLHLIRQRFPRPRIEDLPLAVIREIEKLDLVSKLPPHATVGITAGSRGINNIVGILKTTVDYLKSLQFKPVIIAAMGSHGGGTAEGQREVLDSLGIQEEALGAPIWTGTEVVEVGVTSSGLKAFVNKHVFQTDSTIVINRVKSHTALTGELQSGLTKACVVGLGGPSGAKQFHSLGTKELPRALREIGTMVIEKSPIIGGMAIIENGYEETAYLQSLLAEDFINKEPALFQKSRELMPKLPVDHLDILIIEEMGKNFSGTGIDTNIVGRFRVHGDSEPTNPFIRRIVLFDLSEESHGNANGVGLADIVTEKLVRKIDLKATYLNCMTSTFVQRCFIPLQFPTERESVEMAVASLGQSNPESLRLAIITNTLHLNTLYVSNALLSELLNRSDIEYIREAENLEFNEKGDLCNKISTLKLGE